MQTLHNRLVLVYTIIIMACVISKIKSKNVFLIMGIIGQILLVHLSLDIYRTSLKWVSIHIYALMYVLFVLSNSCLDMYFYLDDEKNFNGFIHKDIGRMFIDFVYVNISTISTIGYGDITPATTMTRVLYCYKMVVAIFMIVFIISYISFMRVRSKTVKPLLLV